MNLEKYLNILTIEAIEVSKSFNFHVSLIYLSPNLSTLNICTRNTFKIGSTKHLSTLG